MATFPQMVSWLREGKKVRRPIWSEGSYWTLGIDERISWVDGATAHIHLNQIEATDWEIYYEDKLKEGTILTIMDLTLDQIAYMKKYFKENFITLPK